MQICVCQKYKCGIVQSQLFNFSNSAMEHIHSRYCYCCFTAFNSDASTAIAEWNVESLNQKKFNISFCARPCSLFLTLLLAIFSPLFHVLFSFLPISLFKIELYYCRQFPSFSYFENEYLNVWTKNLWNPHVKSIRVKPPICHWCWQWYQFYHRIFQSDKIGENYISIANAINKLKSS